MRDLRSDRVRSAGLREERLGAGAGAPGLSSWRGRSGRRYAVGVQPLTEPGLLGVVDAVVAAVRRSGDGGAAIVDVAVAGREGREDARREWMASAHAAGATELHVHRLAATDAERRAVATDLRGEDGAASVGGKPGGVPLRGGSRPFSSAPPRAGRGSDR